MLAQSPIVKSQGCDLDTLSKILLSHSQLLCYFLLPLLVGFLIITYLPKVYVKCRLA